MVEIFFWDTDGTLLEEKELLKRGKIMEYPFTSLFLQDEDAPLLEAIIPKGATLSFLGGGSYHFLTYFYLKRLQSPFSLLLIDHHNDFFLTEFSMLSCGNWLRHAISLPNLRQVYFLGQAGEVVHPKIINLAPGEVTQLNTPLYVSIDKDILSREELPLSWEQGDWPKKSLFEALNRVDAPLFGADICGEPLFRQENFSLDQDRNMRISESINLEILLILEKKSFL